MVVSRSRGFGFLFGVIPYDWTLWTLGTTAAPRVGSSEKSEVRRKIYHQPRYYFCFSQARAREPLGIARILTAGVQHSVSCRARWMGRAPGGRHPSPNLEKVEPRFRPLFHVLRSLFLFLFFPPHPPPPPPDSPSCLPLVSPSTSSRSVPSRPPPARYLPIPPLHPPQPQSWTASHPS